MKWPGHPAPTVPPAPRDSGWRDSSEPLQSLNTMNKQLLTFASISVLALTCPVPSLIAAPVSGSTEQADRQFLSNLENSDAARSAPAPAAVPDVENQASQERPAQAKTSSPANKKTEVARASDREGAPQAASPAKKSANYAKPTARERTAQTSDAVETETTKHASRERTSQPHDPAEKGALQTAPIKKTNEHISYSPRERTVQPADAADSAPLEPIQSRSKTVTIVRSTDRDHDRVQDEDRGEDHGFFHRLFNHALSKHPEDW
jgi:hypothetical protein